MRNKRIKLSVDQLKRLCELRGTDFKKYRMAKDRSSYRVRLKENELKFLGLIDNSKDNEKIKEDKLDKIKSLYSEEEINTLIDVKENASTISLYKIKSLPSTKERNVGIALMSDWHADEVVNPDTVLGKNEYNKKIAEDRITCYFSNLVKMINKRPVNELIVGCLGDLIGGWIHDELAQTNSMTPMQGANFVKALVVSGLKYINDNLPDLDRITFVGICGNHSRTTKRMQFSNGYALSYEYFMYKDIEQTCSMLGLNKISFNIPQSEFAYVECMGRMLLFAHGHQFKYAGGIGGIYPSMLRWFSKLNQILRIDKAFMGHWHTSIYTKEVMVNSSIKGFDAYAMGKGLPCEEPQQGYVILNEKRGFIEYTPIFCN